MTGILASVPADRYHADQVGDQPTLSASLACVLVERSPLHAWTLHPRLNPNWQPEPPADHFDVGDVVHQALLEGVNNVEVVEYDNWRTNAAKDARAAAREAGKIPLLAKDAADVDQMINAARDQIVAHQAWPPLLDEGLSEVTLAWVEDGVHCRARLDWLRDDHTIIDDVKTVAGSARPDVFARQLFKHGYDTKAAFYLRGVKAVTGVDALFRWIVIEKTPPYALSVVTPGPDVLALGDARVTEALRLWKGCVASNRWPAYDPRVLTVDAPGYELARWEEREAS